MRSNGKLETTVFSKETNNNIYLYCKVFFSYCMEKRYIKDIKRAYTVCSNDNLLLEELHHIESCFIEINDYPRSLLKQTFDSFKTNNKHYNTNINNENNNDTNINNLSDKIVHTTI